MHRKSIIYSNRMPTKLQQNANNGKCQQKELLALAQLLEALRIDAQAFMEENGVPTVSIAEWPFSGLIDFFSMSSSQKPLSIGGA